MTSNSPASSAGTIFPSDILCSLNGKPMVDPVVALDGFSYDRTNIEEWFLAQSGKVTTSPSTKEEIDTLLIPNRALRERIEQYQLTTAQQTTPSSPSLPAVFDNSTIQFEQQLQYQHEEQQYHRLIETANAPIFGIDKSGNVNVWNRMSTEITEYTKDDTIGAHLVTEFITPEYRKSVQQVLDRALEGQETANFEFPLITKSGARVEVLLNASTRRDANGSIIGVVGIGQDITVRKIAENKLEEVALDLSNLIDTANAPIFGVDQHGRVTEWNKKASDITEYASDYVMGRNLVDEFIRPEFQKSVNKIFLAALQGTPTNNFEFPLWTKTGQRLQVLLNANPRRNASGTIVGVVGVGQDITSRLAQEQEYVRLIDTANAPIFGIDENFNVNVWNVKAAEITQFTKEEVMGHNLVNEFITPEFRLSVQEVLDRALIGQETANFEFPLITKSGARVEVLLNATSRRDARGNVTGVVGIGQNVTSFLSQQQEFARLIENANAPIFGIDKNFNVNVWNVKAAEITQFTKQEVMGHNLVNEFITPEFRHSVQEVFDLAFAGQEKSNFEFPLITKSGARVEVLLNATTRRDQYGNIMGVVGIGQDITQRKTVERAKMTFLASFSHELRTPLNGLLGMLELLRDDRSLNGAAHRQVVMAHNSSTILLNLINDILDLSKIEAGQLNLASEPFNVHDAISSASELLKSAMEEKGLQLVVGDVCRKKMVVGDVMRLRQVLLNLLSNAIKFTPSGSITIRCWAEEAEDGKEAQKAQEGKEANAVERVKGVEEVQQVKQEKEWKLLLPTLPLQDATAPATTSNKGTAQKTKIFFEVEDTGVGILPSDMAKLFTLFTKISDSRIANRAGSGLGLAICKQLVNLMDGTIRVESKYGVGSCFSFFLLFDQYHPDSKEAEVAVAAAAAAVGSLNRTRNVISWTSGSTNGSFEEMNIPPEPNVHLGMPGATILVAEDNPFNWEITKTFIEMANMKYVWAQNGQQALDLFTKQPNQFDLILMDCQMPVMDGYEATRQIRNFEEQFQSTGGALRIPIVTLTAHAMSGDQTKCLSCGMDGYLTKPISRKLLVQSIVNHINLNNRFNLNQERRKKEAAEKEQTIVFDVKHLLHQVGGNTKMVGKVISKFKLYLPKSIGLVKSAYDHKDLKELCSSLHSLKGAAASAGALHLLNVVRTIEQLCKDMRANMTKDGVGGGDEKNRWPNNAVKLKELDLLVREVEACTENVLLYHQKAV